MLVDSHCHLDTAELISDLPGVISRAQAVGVSAFHTICTQISAFDKILRISKAYSNIFCSIGNHPLNLQDQAISSAHEIAELCHRHPKIVSIGETGLDYHYDEANKEKQKESFIQHIEASQQTGLPLVIHTRDADRDTVSLLQERMSKKSFSGIIHCFTASEWLADACIEMGLYISASGIITFKNADNIRKVFKKIALNKILLETDAPFLAPTPHRGKINEPSYIRHIADYLAALREEEIAVIENITTQNFFDVCSRAVNF